MPISVTLRDSRNNLIATQTVNADEFGALHGEFSLGDQPSLGWYTLALTLNGQMQTQRLRVEAYRKPEYQVTVNTANEHTIGNDSIPVTVAADYSRLGELFVVVTVIGLVVPLAAIVVVRVARMRSG